ncbi:MAG: flavodoxin family protein [Pseudomonadota bacterium]
MVNIAVVYHSGYGHTARQAQAVADGAAGIAGVRAQLVPVENVEQHWRDLESADAIVFGSPTYMGSVSAPFKAFMDKSSKAWAAQQWKDKIAAGFTNSASHSGDKLNTLIQLAVFAAQHGMHWVSLGLLPGNNSRQGSPEDLNRLGSYLGAMAQSDSDAAPEIAPTGSDLRTAAHLGRRVAEAALGFALARERKAA